MLQSDSVLCAFTYLVCIGVCARYQIKNKKNKILKKSRQKIYLLP